MDTQFSNPRAQPSLASGQRSGSRACFSLLALEHAQVIYAEDGSFRVFDGAGWFAFSKDLEAGPGSRVIRTVSPTGGAHGLAASRL